jgi:hypothetical protein
LKWRAFRTKRRPLEDFESFDAASRGPWGSFAFLFLVNHSRPDHRNKDFWTKLRHAASKNVTYYLGKFSALLIVLIFFGDPFLQQAIQQVTCAQTVSEDGGRLARTNNFTILGVDPELWTSNNFYASPGIQTALELALFAPSQQPTSIIPIDCSSGNCTFPQVSTVGVCHSCEDVSDSVRNASGNSNIANFTLEVGETDIWVGGATYFRTGAITNAGSNPDLGPYVNVSFLIGPDDSGVWRTDRKDTPTAATCTLFPCVREFDSSITNGVLSENSTTSTRIWTSQLNHWQGFGITVPPGPWSYQLASTTGLHNNRSHACQRKKEYAPDLVLVFEANIDASPPFPMATGVSSGGGTVEFWDPGNYDQVWFPRECVWSLEVQAFSTVSEWVVSELGSLSVAQDLGMTAVAGPLPATRLWQNGRGNLSSTNAFVGNVADFLTAAIRQNGDTGKVQYENGTITINATCIQIVWPWVSFHAIATGLTLLFLLIIVSKTEIFAAERLWKSSILAVLFCDMDADSHEAARQQPTRGGIARAAKDINVRLVDNLDGTSRFQ